MKNNIRVSDAMRRSVVTIHPQDTVDEALKAMVELDIGCVVVSEKEKPVGIITDSNMLERVFYQKKNPSQVKAEEVMSHPLKSVEPQQDLEEVAALMRDLRLKRLPVINEGKLVGIITETELINISPALIEITAENIKMRSSFPSSRSSGVSVTGICDVCGNHSEDLQLSEGMLVCPDCREE